ncbi:hypothetical protein, partial [Alteromonas stellipolaris]|uniref:hypothetical protein n=1 Tax=Alteromonas stellipolaris TaxID=233316 RepID=UPI001D5A0255
DLLDLRARMVLTWIEWCGFDSWVGVLIYNPYLSLFLFVVLEFSSPQELGLSLGGDLGALLVISR